MGGPVKARRAQADSSRVTVAPAIPAGRIAAVLRRAAGEERGAFLVESLVAAVLLVILSLGFLSAIDTAARTSGQSERRAAAASLAQEDIERMRALKPRDLAQTTTSRTQTVRGVSYTIVSRAVWIDDTTDSVTCPSGATRTDYLKVSSTVTWPVMDSIRPVVSESLLAIPLGAMDGGTGGLIIRLRGVSGAGAAGIPGSLTGPASVSGASDADGCIFWTGLPAGSYTLSFGQAGWVDRNGNQTVTQPTSVVGGATNSLDFPYDRAARLDASFETKVGASAPQSSKARAVTVANNGMAPPGTRAFTVGTPATSITSGYTLYPFTDGYAVWAGACDGADPRLYGQSAPFATIAPGAAGVVTVRQPAVNVLVTPPSGVAMSALDVRITPTTPGCGAAFGGTGLLSAGGALLDPGLPYGDYAICVDDNRATPIRKQVTVQNRAAAGTATTAIDLRSGTTSGGCP